jgi:radical SAM superfamily enzyme YgiQ (UPF0313 family)
VAISRALFQAPERPLCIWGGEHATFFAERILEEHVEVDGVVLSEGEETFAELIERRLAWLHERSESGDENDWADGPVVGACLRGRDGAILNGGYRAAVTNLDDLPVPDKDIVELAIANNKPVTISLMTGRGCYHRCRFCTAHEFMRLGGGNVWRRRSPAAVADELQALLERYQGHPLVHPIFQFQDVIFPGDVEGFAALDRRLSGRD